LDLAALIDTVVLQSGPGEVEPADKTWEAHVVQVLGHVALGVLDNLVALFAVGLAARIAQHTLKLGVAGEVTLAGSVEAGEQQVTGARGHFFPQTLARVRSGDAPVLAGNAFEVATAVADLRPLGVEVDGLHVELEASLAR